MGSPLNVTLPLTSPLPPQPASNRASGSTLSQRLLPPPCRCVPAGGGSLRGVIGAPPGGRTNLACPGTAGPEYADELPSSGQGGMSILLSCNEQSLYHPGVLKQDLGRRAALLLKKDRRTRDAGS